MTKLETLSQFRKKFKSDADAAKALEVDYMQFRRWIKKLVYAPENASTRKLVAMKGVELPRRP